MALFGGQRDISLFRSINRELINNIIDTKVDIIKHAIKDIKENLYGEALGKQYFKNNAFRTRPIRKSARTTQGVMQQD